MRSQIRKVLDYIATFSPSYQKNQQEISRLRRKESELETQLEYENKKLTAKSEELSTLKEELTNSRQEYQTRISQLEKNLQTQTSGIGILKYENFGLLKKLAEAKEKYFDIIKRATEDGYFLFGENRAEKRKGHCVLIDRKGKIISTSPKFQNTIDYFGGYVSFTKIIEELQFDFTKKTIIPELKIQTEKKEIGIRDVEIIPINLDNTNLGYAVHFKELGLLQKAIRVSRGRKEDAVSRVQIYNLIKSTEEMIAPMNRKIRTNLKTSSP